MHRIHSFDAIITRFKCSMRRILTFLQFFEAGNSFKIQIDSYWFELYGGVKCTINTHDYQRYIMLLVKREYFFSKSVSVPILDTGFLLLIFQ
jgi:hypothetical protein